MTLLLALLLQLTPVPPPITGHYCPAPAARHRATVRRFERLTGYPHGRPGYVVDHIVPLCACGANAPENMQWETARESYLKDRRERAFCAALKKAR